MRWIFGALFFLTFSCSKGPEEEFRQRGAKITNEMAQMLSQVQSHEQLQALVPRLKKKFNSLADLLLELRSCKEKGSESWFLNESTEESEALFAELARLYEIPGCREIIEGAQGEAITKLYPT